VLIGLLEKMKLYSVAIQAQPTADHPCYWDWETCVVVAWLFAESVQNAADRAAAILSELPYEVTSKESEVSDPPWTDTPAYVEKEREARMTGLAVFVLTTLAGSDVEVLIPSD
jgi:hypothetical protein